MSSAYKCDRCGILFSNREYAVDCVLVKSLLPRDDYHEYDLCPRCQAELERWFHVQGKTNR